jgi:hypothetical protein
MTLFGFVFLWFTRHDSLPGPLPYVEWQPGRVFYLILMLIAAIVGGLAIHSGSMVCGRKMRRWFGIIGTTSEFMYMYALAAIAGAALQLVVLSR